MKVVSQITVNEKEVQMCKELIALHEKVGGSMADLVSAISNSVMGIYNHYSIYKIKIEEGA